MRVTTQTALRDGIDPRALNDEAQRRFVLAITTKDYAGLSALFAEHPIFSPVGGGVIEDREGIRAYYAQDATTALELRSARLEMMSDTLLFDTGSFTATLSEAVGGGTFEGEYVALSDVTEDGLRIRCLTAFPKRQPPSAPG